MRVGEVLGKTPDEAKASLPLSLVRKYALYFRWKDTRRESTHVLLETVAYHTYRLHASVVKMICGVNLPDVQPSAFQVRCDDEQDEDPEERELRLAIERAESDLLVKESYKALFENLPRFK